MLAPVVLFVYARPEHTKKTIESLAKNHLAEQTEVYIYSDAPKKGKSEEAVKSVRDYIDTLSDRNLFKSVKVIKANINKGLANSVISGVDEIIEKYGKVIVVEDDLVTSSDFLQYMNDSLNYFENDNEIWSISGYTFNIKFPQDYKSDIFLSYRGCSWGWATWKNRWEKVDWNVSDYDEFKVNRKLRKQLNRGGRDLAYMLDHQMQGKIDSWAIRWCYTQSKLNMFTVYPTVSRIKNIGLDGSGTHSGETIKYDVNLNDVDQKIKLENPGLNKYIVKSFKEKYGNRSEYFKIYLKSVLKKVIFHN